MDMARMVGLLACAAALATAGCRKPAPAAPPPEEVRLPPVEVKKDGSWLFTYVDDKGQFETVDKPDAVPARSRRLVRVVDPSRGVQDRRDTTNVYVVDVNELLRAGHSRARPLSRPAFETGALAQLPPGASSLLADRPADGDIDAGAAGEPAGGGAPGQAVVTVYGAAWCGACKEAKRYLAARNIPFIEKDIERDRGAASELAEKAAKLGIPTDRIPILDVRGRLLIGFDQARLEALLGQAT
jgi:glutaredoxin